MNRIKLREILMQGVFQMEIQGEKDRRLVENFIENMRMSQKEKEDTLKSYEKLVENIENIDSEINAAVLTYKTDKMEKINLAILRVAVFEILYVDDIPTAVSINEAVEIAKKFGSEKSSKFVNGVLGKIAKKYEKVIFRN